MSKTLIDTNILLRLILHDEAKLAAEAEQIVLSSPEVSCVISSVIFGEVVYVLGGLGFKRESIAKVVSELLEYPQFSYPQALFSSILRFIELTNLDFADCYLLARALRENKELKTLDIPLQKAYAREMAKQS